MAIALLICASLVGFLCLVGIGANDVANSQGMAVGSGAISLRGAQIMASIFEFLGAALVGQHVGLTLSIVPILSSTHTLKVSTKKVSSTVGSKIVPIDQVSAEQYSWGMFSAIMATAIWMFTATALKMPVSSTHSIIGALMGFQMVIDPSAQNWEVLGQIGISWIATPMISFVAAALFMLLCDRWWPLFLIDDDSLSNYQQLTDEPIVPEAVPMKAVKPKMKNEESASTSFLAQHFDSPSKPAPVKFAVIFSILWSTLILFILAAGPKSIAILHVVEWWVFVVIGVSSLIFTFFIGYFVERPFRKWFIDKYYGRKHSVQSTLEDPDYGVFNNMDYFSLYLVIASATVSFAHGGNDVANVLGPFGQIFSFESTGDVQEGAAIPIWLAGIGGVCAL